MLSNILKSIMFESSNSESVGLSDNTSDDGTGKKNK